MSSSCALEVLERAEVAGMAVCCSLGVVWRVADQQGHQAMANANLVVGFAVAGSVRPAESPGKLLPVWICGDRGRCGELRGRLPV